MQNDEYIPSKSWSLSCKKKFNNKVFLFTHHTTLADRFCFICKLDETHRTTYPSTDGSKSDEIFEVAKTFSPTFNVHKSKTQSSSLFILRHQGYTNIKEHPRKRSTKL